MMKRIPTKLKQLAERRARIAGQLADCSVNNEALTKEFSELNGRLTVLKPYLDRSSKDLSQLTKNLTEVDAAIIEHYPSINPKAIDPIRGRQGRYGQRGSLKKFILAEFKSCYPQYLQISDVTLSAIAKFSLVFASVTEERKFWRSGIRGAIHSLTVDGKLERGDDIVRQGQNCGQWRLKQDVQPTLAALSAQSDTIAAAGHSQLKSAIDPSSARWPRPTYLQGAATQNRGDDRE